MFGHAFTRFAGWATVAVTLADPNNAIPTSVQGVVVAVGALVVAVSHLAESFENAARHKSSSTSS